MKDIETRNDIEILVNTFYNKLKNDSKIGFFFNDIAKVTWADHLPKMYLFWESLLFGKGSYKGNPMQKHFPINSKSPIEKHHFDHWLETWTSTVFELFEGENANLAVYKAKNIANLMAFKMDTATKLENNSMDK